MKLAKTIILQVNLNVKSALTADSQVMWLLDHMEVHILGFWGNVNRANSIKLRQDPDIQGLLVYIDL